MQKLTIIVTCTDRKSMRPQPRHLLRDLSGLSLPERHDAWCRRIASAVEKRALDKLYAGEAWRQTQVLMGMARSAGFEPTLYVASAGLGLRRSDTLAPAYGATFSPGAPDSVGRGQGEARDWWQRFQERGGASLCDVAGPSTLLVLSAAYSRALEMDLATLADTPGDHLLVGGHHEIPGLRRLPSDLALQSVLGGTASSLNTRMAAAWIQRLDGPKLLSASRARAWTEWSTKVRHVKTYERAALTDAQITTFVRDLRREHPTISQTVALRTLRDTGRACEQKRFRTIFNSVVMQ